jgi:hypothetical protein
MQRTTGRGAISCFLIYLLAARTADSSSIKAVNFSSARHNETLSVVKRTTGVRAHRIAFLIRSNCREASQLPDGCVEVADIVPQRSITEGRIRVSGDVAIERGIADGRIVVAVYVKMERSWSSPHPVSRLSLRACRTFTRFFCRYRRTSA